ncbi:hypothetical protein [Paracoccus yeei]|nr:hypothetical protein [Paracoccus yeei]
MPAWRSFTPRRCAGRAWAGPRGGRIGAIAGPTFGGVLLAWGMPPGQNFLIFAIPAAVPALAMLVFAVSQGRARDSARQAAA